MSKLNKNIYPEKCYSLQHSFHPGTPSASCREPAFFVFFVIFCVFLLNLIYVYFHTSFFLTQKVTYYKNKPFCILLFKNSFLLSVSFLSSLPPFLPFSLPLSLPSLLPISPLLSPPSFSLSAVPSFLLSLCLSYTTDLCLDIDRFPAMDNIIYIYFLISGDLSSGYILESGNAGSRRNVVLGR